MSLNPAVIALWVVPFLMAVVFHEWAHGRVAKAFGDDTASSLGRLTLNPIAHIDPVGTLALPALLLATGSPFLFGWAKPVPVAYSRLRNPRRDMVLVALAGPAMNLALAVACAVALWAVVSVASPVETGGVRIAEPLAQMCWMGLQLNVLLAVFNMLPIPPLDGGRVAVGLLPPALGLQLARLEPFGILIVMGLLLTGVLNSVIAPVMRTLVGALSGLAG